MVCRPPSHHRTGLAPCSPDLNVIEHVWAKIVQEWRPEYERTAKALAAHAQRVWESLRNEPQFFHNLVADYHARLDAVIAAQGGPTTY